MRKCFLLELWWELFVPLPLAFGFFGKRAEVSGFWWRCMTQINVFLFFCICFVANTASEKCVNIRGWIKYLFWGRPADLNAVAFWQQNRVAFWALNTPHFFLGKNPNKIVMIYNDRLLVIIGRIAFVYNYVWSLSHPTLETYLPLS